MSKYIKIFNTESEYNAYSGGTDFITPNISYIKGTDKTKYDENEIRSYKEPSWIEVIPKEEYTDTTFDVIKAVYKVDIPNGTTTINQGAFRNCTNLVEVIIPNTVTEIKGGTITKYGTYENNAPFENCSSLTSINIPSGVTYIGINAFSNCTSLSSITFSSGSILIEISVSAFQNCNSLTSIDIPSGVTSISDWAFRNCSSLTSITILATVPPTLGSRVFENTNCPIYVPIESVEAFKTATNWSAYADRIQPIPNE